MTALGGVINRDLQKPEVKDEIRNYSWSSMVERMPEFFAQRQKLMPEPERASEWLNQLKSMWVKNVLTSEEASLIECPVLIIGGDREEHSPPEAYIDTYNAITNSQLSIIPNAVHTDLLFREEIMNTIVIPFIMNFK